MSNPTTPLAVAVETDVAPSTPDALPDAAAPSVAAAVPDCTVDDDDDDVLDLTGRPLEPYDPADYRWVPVRRRARYDGWTEEKQRRFIEVLADTGMVAAAARAVGMTRESAYRLRRAAHGAAFARAWDAARHHAGSLIEDIAFERAIEGVEHNVYDENGEVVCTKRVYNDRLLTFLLGHLKPERYAKTAGAAALDRPLAEPPAPVEAVLHEMEPQLPAPAEDLLDPETLDHELHLADVADGVLPHFLREQRPEKSAARLKAEAEAAQDARGKAALDRVTGKKLGERIETSRQDMIDMTRYLDPASRNERSRKRFR